MMSLRLCVLFLALAASSLGDNTSRLPFKVSVGYGCSGVVVSRNQILSVGQCALSTGGVDIKKGTQSHDSGEIYFLNRIVYHPQIHDYEQKMDYVLYTVDRDIEAEEGFEPAELPAGNVTLTEGQICTTVRRKPEQTSAHSSWFEQEHHRVQVISSSKCAELNPDFPADKYVCVGLNPEDTSPYNQCNGDNGAPLVCDGYIVAINVCDFSCFGEACAYRKLDNLRDFIGH